jgi:hypothetical protein
MIARVPPPRLAASPPRLIASPPRLAALVPAPRLTAPHRAASEAVAR